MQTRLSTTKDRFVDQIPSPLGRTICVTIRRGSASPDLALSA